MKRILDIINKIPAFNGLSEKQLNEIKSIAVDRRFKKGEIIFTEGDEGNGFYVVIDGQVKIFKLSPEGKEQILHIFGSGDPVGEVAVFAGRSFPANAEAITATRVLFFPRAAFLDLISANPSLAMKMLV